MMIMIVIMIMMMIGQRPRGSGSRSPAPREQMTSSTRSEERLGNVPRVPDNLYSSTQLLVLVKCNLGR